MNFYSWRYSHMIKYNRLVVVNVQSVMFSQFCVRLIAKPRRILLGPIYVISYHFLLSNERGHIWVPISLTWDIMLFNLGDLTPKLAWGRPELGEVNTYLYVYCISFHRGEICVGPNPAPNNDFSSFSLPACMNGNVLMGLYQSVVGAYTQAINFYAPTLVGGEASQRFPLVGSNI
jgi:hypothetical protein